MRYTFLEASNLTVWSEVFMGVADFLELKTSYFRRQNTQNLPARHSTYYEKKWDIYLLSDDIILAFGDTYLGV